jgi:hypothetical protein
LSHIQVQLGRGSSAQIAAYTGPQGEASVNTDDFSLALHDGVTAGGKTRLLPGMVTPQGRLTLTSGTPVLSTDTTAAATLYYTPYQGAFCPIFNGTVWQVWPFAETSLALDSNTGHTGYQASGSLFDVFAFANGGSFAIGTGPAWASTSSRGTGAGTTQISLLNGLWVNSNSIALRFGSASGNTASVGANEATYLGTIYATANGQTGMQFKPAAALGGSNSILGVYNAYNRVRAASRCVDSTSTWSYTTAYWRALDGSTSNRITYVDGLGQSTATAKLSILMGGSAGGGNYIGVSFNAVGAPTGVTAGGVTGAQASYCIFDHNIALGLNYAQAVEEGSASSATLIGGAYEGLELETDA